MDKANVANNGFPYDRVITSDKFLVKLGQEVGDLVNLVLILNDELERIRKNSIERSVDFDKRRYRNQLHELLDTF